jgi:hypothetical protein
MRHVLDVWMHYMCRVCYTKLSYALYAYMHTHKYTGKEKSRCEGWFKASMCMHACMYVYTYNIVLNIRIYTGMQPKKSLRTHAYILVKRSLRRYTYIHLYR